MCVYKFYVRSQLPPLRTAPRPLFIVHGADVVRCLLLLFVRSLATRRHTVGGAFPSAATVATRRRRPLTRLRVVGCVRRSVWSNYKQL